MKALCTCFSFSSWLIQTDRIRTPYYFLSLRSLARRFCRAVVNPVVLLAFELQFSFPDLLRLMFLLLFQKVIVFFLLWSFSCEKQIILMKRKFWNETNKISKCHVFIDWSRYCNLSTRSATYHLLRCALDYRRSSSDFEPRNWYLQLSRKVCHLHRLWWNGRTWQTLFLVFCFLSNYIYYNYHCCFFCCKNVWLFGRRDLVVAHLDLLLRETQTVFDTTVFDTYNSFWYKVNFRNKPKQRKPKSSSPGFEPATSGLEVQRAIHCATRTSGICECQLQRVSGIGLKALCTCFSSSSWLIQTDRIKTPYHFLSLRSLARRLCRAVVNPVVLLACELLFSFLELLCLMFLFLF